MSNINKFDTIEAELIFSDDSDDKHIEKGKMAKERWVYTKVPAY